MAEEQLRVELFTDGACTGNPGPGGWAFILRSMSTGKEISRSGGQADTTNNQMELLAVIKGLKQLKKSSVVDLYCDSKYVVDGLGEWLDNWIAKGWRRANKKKVMNLELWQELDRLRQKHTLNPIWIQGHNEHPENERCDQLATAAAERYAAP